MDPHGYKILLFFAYFVLCSLAGRSTIPGHYTARKNLSCYFCHTLTHGDLCQQTYYNVQTVASDLPVRQCATEDKHCIVRRHSYALNNSDVKVWMMERDCSKSCINECVISLTTGDRMKLHLCTSCCESNLCNVGNGANREIHYVTLLSILLMFVAVMLSSTSSSTMRSVFIYLHLPH